MADKDPDLLEVHQRRNPLTWRDLLRRQRPLTALELASSALEECRVMQLDHRQRAEFHTAMVAMLAKREARLRADVQRLSRVAKGAAEDPAPQEGEDV